MKEILTRNASLKVLSLLIAFFLWLIVVNIEDPVITGTFEGIPVTVINENAVASRDKVYDIVSEDVVDVEVKGKRSIIESLSRADFQAIADLSKLSFVNAMEIKVSLLKYGDEIEIINQSVSTMEVSIENLVTEQFRINIVERGTVAEGFYVNEKTASPNMIQVSGAESVIRKIKEVVVVVDVSNANKSFVDTTTPMVYDHNGTLMNLDKMSFSHKEFDITVNLLETKTVKLFLELEGNPAPGFSYVNFEYEPKEVVIAGSKEVLEKVPNIVGTYDISNSKVDIEDEVNIADFIKEDVILIDENQNAVVNIDIEPIESKSITFQVDDIEVRNLPEDKRVEFVNPSSLTVNVQGVKDTISKVNKENIKPYIDLSTPPKNGIVPVHFNSGQNNLQFSEIKTSVLIKDK